MRDGYLLPVVGGSENMDVNVASVVKSKTQKMKVEELKKIVESHFENESDRKRVICVNMEKKLGMESAFSYEEVKERTAGNITKWVIHKGMSKRFYAACAAMQGILSGETTMGAVIRAVEKTDTDINYAVCKMAYEFADELLKQEEL
jgi:hypothetical protein